MDFLSYNNSQQIQQVKFKLNASDIVVGFGISRYYFSDIGIAHLSTVSTNTARTVHSRDGGLYGHSGLQCGRYLASSLVSLSISVTLEVAASFDSEHVFTDDCRDWTESTPTSWNY